jgi:hypothetical protein
MSYMARASIRNDYEPKIKDVQEKLNKILGQDITIVPNFEANFEKLKSKAGTDSNWEDNFGNFPFLYFEALVSQLQYDKFGEDDMLQEALLEVMEKRAVHFRVVDQTKRSYNETVIEDGILYLQVLIPYICISIMQTQANIYARLLRQNLAPTSIRLQTT